MRRPLIFALVLADVFFLGVIIKFESCEAFIRVTSAPAKFPEP